MRDYKPQMRTAKRHVFRKLVLFTVIAVTATFFFFQLEQQPSQVIKPDIVSTPLALPEIPGKPIETPVPAGIQDNATEIATHSLAEDLSTEIAEEQKEITEQANEPIEQKRIQLESATSSQKPAITETSLADLPVMSPIWETHSIKSGDSLANIFKEWNLSATTLHNIVNSSKLAKKLADIHPGETLKLLRSDDGELLELVVERSPTESLLIKKMPSGYDSKIVLREVEVRHAYASGNIDTSLFIDGQNAGLTDAQIMEMAGIFGWDIDFALEIRKGDSFKLLFEEHFLDGKKLRNGPILVAKFQNNKKTFKAIRYTTPDGLTSYYDPEDGRNKKRTFIRTPVKFARISSRFSGKRYHPKLKKWRAHRGVDYAAPTGTAVKAAGNGKVIFRGKKGGYGNVVILQHGSKYTTLYAHLSKFSRSSKKGKNVTQGQIIGYVGQTGLATGPHLHYEFRVNGVHRNPLTVKLPKADPINKKYQKDFQDKASELLAQFNLLADDSQQIAQAAKKPVDG